MLWWGYTNKDSWKIQVKRFFDDRDIEEAKESPFVGRVFGPFEASTRGEVFLKIKRRV